MTDHEELCAWIRENLVIHVEPLTDYGPSNDIFIGLRFKFEDRPFTRELITIHDHD